MKIVRIISFRKKIDPSKLSNELIAAGVTPDSFSVWATGGALEEPSTHGVVQLADATKVGLVKAVINTHVELGAVAQEQSLAEKNGVIAQMVSKVRDSHGTGVIEDPL